MPEGNLKFNPETMNYEATKKKHSLLRNIVYIAVTSLAFGLVFTIILINVIKSPEERKKEHDLQVYKQTYEDLSEKFEENLQGVKELEKQDKKLFQNIFETKQVDSSFLSDNIIKDVNDQSSTIDLAVLTDRTSKMYSNIYKFIKKEKSLSSFIAYFISNNSEYMESLPINVPLKDKSYTLVSGYGERIHPIFKTTRQHNGIDFAARAGSPVMASGNGIVENPPEKLAGYGTVVMINHGNGIKSIYAQLLDKKVKTGQKVKTGDVIGFVGNTGISIGPHLHFEIWINNKAENPMNFLLAIPTETYIDMLKKASQFNQCMS